MAQQERPEHHADYEETVDPKNPPNSVLRPQVRTATVSTFVGGIVIFFLIVGAALVYWSMSNRRLDPDPGRREAQAEADSVGTGFNPEPRPGSTRDELEYRGGSGAGDRPDALGSILEDAPATVIGRRVSFRDVSVTTAEGSTFWIHDGDAKVQVVQSGTTVRDGQKVDVSGVVESDGRAGVRIKADRVSVR